MPETKLRYPIRIVAGFDEQLLQGRFVELVAKRPLQRRPRIARESLSGRGVAKLGASGYRECLLHRRIEHQIDAVIESIARTAAFIPAKTLFGKFRLMGGHEQRSWLFSGGRRAPVVGGLVLSWWRVQHRIEIEPMPGLFRRDAEGTSMEDLETGQVGIDAGSILLRFRQTVSNGRPSAPARGLALFAFDVEVIDRFDQSEEMLGQQVVPAFRLQPAAGSLDAE
ncbi:MAG: hypothetical protein R3F54_30585 [Alphaproteobacteria bacterium]